MWYNPEAASLLTHVLQWRAQQRLRPPAAPCSASGHSQQPQPGVHVYQPPADIVRGILGTANGSVGQQCEVDFGPWCTVTAAAAAGATPALGSIIAWSCSDYTCVV